MVSSLEVNHKPVELARKGTEVCIKVSPSGGEAPRLLGRHFEQTDLLISKVRRPDRHTSSPPRHPGSSLPCHR